MELANDRAEPFALREGEACACVGIAVVVPWLGVACPDNLVAVVLQREEADDGVDRNRRAEGSGGDIVVLRPPSEETALDVDVEEPTDRDTRPEVVETTGRVVQTTLDEDGDVDLKGNVRSATGSNEHRMDGRLTLRNSLVRLLTKKKTTGRMKPMAKHATRPE